VRILGVSQILARDFCLVRRELYPEKIVPLFAEILNIRRVKNERKPSL
jgi:hypothetical protein